MAEQNNFDASFKAKVAIEALKEDKTLQELAKEYNVSSSLISSWKEELISNSSAAFSHDENDKKEMARLKAENDRMIKMLGQQDLEINFLASACEDAGLKVR